MNAILRNRLLQLDNLAPGDFAVVKRQAGLLGETLAPSDFLAELENESRLKPGANKQAMGFCTEQNGKGQIRMENFELPQLTGESCKPNIAEILSAIVTQIDHQQQSGSSELPLTGVSTGFPEIDALTLGLQAGELILLAGRPGRDAMPWHLKFVEHIAGTLGLPVVFHSLTNPLKEVGLRLLRAHRS